MVAMGNCSQDVMSRSFKFLLLRQIVFETQKVDSFPLSGIAIKFTLRAIDDHAAPLCTASCMTLARETCQSERTVRRAIKYLASIGFIEVKKRYGYTQSIEINWDRIQEKVSEHLILTTPETTAQDAETIAGHAESKAALTETVTDKTDNPNLTINQPERIQKALTSLDEVRAYFLRESLNCDERSIQKFFSCHKLDSRYLHDWREKAQEWAERELRPSNAPHWDKRYGGVNHDPTGGRKVGKL